uniref:Methyltransferase domain-containing protein n=1 Tax=Candidatus Kentrum sp. MB TaxID=2138164 RepID=A0A451B9X2_9GAMM|nr:MAG: Methyltransferase domain-containing protein [Candidatus Kentron sp. MB]VFK27178.1 MAG: Methyltransferase domain-containing protein [Candidatus Kentron sp. MB]VFK75081.1 MAG: Methyltransferase domain-containing protein [Candidatus Kentron sp. MB]
MNKPQTVFLDFLKARMDFPNEKELRKRMRAFQVLPSKEENFWGEDGHFWTNQGEAYKTYSYYWHTEDKAKIIEHLARHIVEAISGIAQPEILDVGTGMGNKILDVMMRILILSHQLPVVDITEPHEHSLKLARQFLPHHEHGGFLRDAFLTIEETGPRKYDVVLLNNSIYYFEPFEESIPSFLEQLNPHGLLLILFTRKALEFETIIPRICRETCQEKKIDCDIKTEFLPLRIFSGREYGEVMTTMLREDFCAIKYCDDPISNREFTKLLKEASVGGFVNFEHGLLAIRKK